MESRESTHSIVNRNSVEAIPAPKTLLEAIRYYSDLDLCVDFFASLRWPNGVTCPYCQSMTVGYVATRHIFKCKNKECRKQFSVKVGTIFEDSPIGLDKWLITVWMIANCKNGISSYEVHRAIGVTQKSAWFMLHRIRVAMQTGSFMKISGTIEADETFIGGKAKNMHKDKKAEKITGRGASGKEVVMGILERGETYTDKHGETKKTASRVRTTVIKDTSKESLQGEVKSTVVGGSEVFTDAARGYQGLSEEYIHEFVDHAVQYVEGRVHTNSLENFWSLTKRMLRGTYVSVEPEHLLSYLDEQTFRFNEREKNDGGRFVKVLSQAAGKRLTYKGLIGDPQGVDSPDPLRGGPRAD